MYAPDLLRKLTSGSSGSKLKSNIKLGLETLNKLFLSAAVGNLWSQFDTRFFIYIATIGSRRFVVLNVQAKHIAKRKQDKKITANVFKVSVYNLQMWISAGDPDHTLFKQLVSDALTLEVMYDRPDEAMMCIHHK